MKSGFTDERRDGAPEHNGDSSAESGEQDRIESPGVDEPPSEESRAEGDDARAAHESKGKKQKKKGLKGKGAELEEALEKAEREAAENYDLLLRARAEYDNLRKRTRREIQQVHLRAGENLVRELLPAIDNLEKAIEASQSSQELRPMMEGLLLIQKGMMEPLKASGVDAMNSLGERFDPNFHEAMMQIQTDEAEPGTVVQVLQKGYLMNGVVLRPAKVIVAGAVDEPGAGERGAGDSGADGEEAVRPADQGEPSGGEV